MQRTSLTFKTLEVMKGKEVKNKPDVEQHNDL